MKMQTTHSSSAMVRKDSSSISPTSIFTQLAPSSAGFTPGLSPWASGAFHPQGGVMDQLNQGSEPDRQTQTANIGRPLAAIGSPPGVYKKSAPTFHLGPAFHTDGENNGRFVAVSKVPHHWTFGSNLQNFFAESGLDRQCHGHVVCLGEIGFVKMLLFFDDIRHATESKTMFYSYLRTAQFEFITREQYFEADKDHPRASVQSQFDGQIQFVAKYIGSARDFDLAATFKTMREYAETFGEIRTFSLLELNDITTTVFRVEYFSLDSADNACEPGDLKEFIELEDDTLIVNITAFTGLSLPGVVVAPLRDDSLELSRDLSAGLGAMALNTPSSSWTAPASRRGAMSAGAVAESHTGLRSAARRPYMEFSQDVAPEYRNRAARDHSPMIARSGIQDNLNYDVLRASGPEDIHNQPQMVILRHIIQGIDCRTTVMVRNIPNKLDAVGLKIWLDHTSFGLYDFSYLRVDFSNNCNVGYAFVNFVKPEHIVDFVQQRVSKPWGLYGSEKTCEISYATVQGQDCLVEKFRNSSVMREFEGFRPKVWYAEDSLDIPEDKSVGEQAPFPKPNNLTKLQRSLDNAQAVGLYPPRHNHNQRGRDSQSNARRSQYDRGTPRALIEERAHTLGPIHPPNFSVVGPNGQVVIYVPDYQSLAQQNLALNGGFVARPFQYRGAVNGSQQPGPVTNFQQPGPVISLQQQGHVNNPQQYGQHNFQQHGSTINVQQQGPVSNPQQYTQHNSFQQQGPNNNSRRSNGRRRNNNNNHRDY